MDRYLNLKDRGPCDVTLVVVNGKQFKAHRQVLSKASSFFERLFNSNMKESKEEVVRLEMITESQMSDALKFIYTDSIKLSTQNKAEELIAVADYLFLDGLKDIAQKFLQKKKLSASNCIPRYCLATKYMCEELLDTCRKFIHLNFSTVAELPEFMNLPSAEVEKFISSDEIVISEEEDVFKIILKWIDQDKDQRGVKFPELFRHVRLTCVTRDFLKRKVEKNQFVKENKECSDRVTDALTWLNRRKTKCRSPHPDPPRQSLESCAIVACAMQKPFDCFCYLPDKNEWFRLPRIKERPQQVVSYRGQLFVIHQDIFKSQRYDPDMNQWSPAPWAEMTDSRLKEISGGWFGEVLVVGNEMCFITQNGRNPNELWKFNLETNSLSSPIEWIHGINTCVIAIDKDIYTIGGYKNCDDTVTTITASSDASRYDTIKNKWTKIAPIQVARHAACGVGNNGKIYVAGGINNGEKLTSCEVYDILTDEWQFMSNLEFPRFFSNMVSVNGTLYVLGGRVDETIEHYFPITCVGECYYPKKRHWREAVVIPADQVAVWKTGLREIQESFIFIAGTLKIFKVALNKLKPVGDTVIQMG